MTEDNKFMQEDGSSPICVDAFEAMTSLSEHIQRGNSLHSHSSSHGVPEEQENASECPSSLAVAASISHPPSVSRHLAAQTPASKPSIHLYACQDSIESSSSSESSFAADDDISAPIAFKGPPKPTKKLILPSDESSFDDDFSCGDISAPRAAKGAQKELCKPMLPPDDEPSDESSFAEDDSSVPRAAEGKTLRSFNRSNSLPAQESTNKPTQTTVPARSFQRQASALRVGMEFPGVDVAKVQSLMNQYRAKKDEGLDRSTSHERRRVTMVASKPKFMRRNSCDGFDMNTGGSGENFTRRYSNRKLDIKAKRRNSCDNLNSQSGDWQDSRPIAPIRTVSTQNPKALRRQQSYESGLPSSLPLQGSPRQDSVLPPSRPMRQASGNVKPLQGTTSDLMKLKSIRPPARPTRQNSKDDDPTMGKRQSSQKSPPTIPKRQHSDELQRPPQQHRMLRKTRSDTSASDASRASGKSRNCMLCSSRSDHSRISRTSSTATPSSHVSSMSSSSHHVVSRQNRPPRRQSSRLLSSSSSHGGSQHSSDRSQEARRRQNPGQASSEQASSQRRPRSGSRDLAVSQHSRSYQRARSEFSSSSHHSARGSRPDPMAAKTERHSSHGPGGSFLAMQLFEQAKQMRAERGVLSSSSHL